nr:MAG TPA: hypothetical protein [Caudoviricetes sp.]
MHLFQNIYAMRVKMSQRMLFLIAYPITVILMMRSNLL